MPKKKKKRRNIQQTAEMMASSLPPSDGEEQLASTARLDHDEKLLIDFQREGQINAAYQNDNLQLRSVASFSNYACDQTSNFEMFGARPKSSQTAQNLSYAEIKTLEAPPSTSTVSLQGQTAKSYLGLLQAFEYELNQAKATYQAYMIDGKKNNFSENAILEGRTHPSSPEGKTHPMEGIVSGESEYRKMPTSCLSHRYAKHTQTATNADLPKAAITAPSTGQSNLQEQAEMQYDLSERMLTLHRSFSNLSLISTESRAQMPQLSPQTHVLAPPGGARVLQSGVQQDSVPQEQVIAPPAGHFNVAPQILQSQTNAHVPSAAQSGSIPRQIPGPLPVQQLPQPAPQIVIHQQGSTVAPLAGESKLKVSGQNYRAWVSEIGLLLRREGTLQMVLNPPDQPWTPEIRNLETKACTTLLMSMDTELQITFAADITANQIWIQLENCYRPISLQSSCLLMSEFHSLRLNPGERIGGHLTKLKSMRKDLGERNFPIGDVQMVIIILNSLNYEWKDAIAKINQIPIHQRTVDNVCRALVEEEALMLATPHLRGPFASRAPSRRPFRGRTYVPRTPRCNICDRVGHATRDCPQRVPAPVTHQPRGTDSRGRGDRRGRRGLKRDSQTQHATLALTKNSQSPSIYDRRYLWTLDSGAAIHVTFRKELFTEMHESDLNELYSFSNHPSKVEGKGTVFIEELNAVIPDVYYVPSATFNLLSQSHLSKILKFQVHHLEKASYIIKDGDIVAETILIGGVYYLKPKIKPQTRANKQTPKEESTDPERKVSVRDPVAIPKTPKANKRKNEKQSAQSKPEVPHHNINVECTLTGKPLHSRCIHKWHRRLGHASFRVLKKMPEFTKGMDLKGCKVFLDCAVCKKAKSKAADIPKHATRLSTRIFELIHTDIVGPFPQTLGGRKYFLTIVDNYSRYGYVYPMREKSETFQIFKDFAALVSTQHGVNIARIQSDRGAEYMSQRFKDWMHEKGILHQTSAPYTPAHNGVAERRQGVLQTMMRCLLEDANLSKPYWGEALKYANYIINRTWSSVINQTPFFKLYGYKPDLKNLRIFGSYAMVNIPLDLRRKGSPIAKKLRFMGFDDNSKCSKFIDSNHKLTFSNSANFEEDADWSRIHSNDPGTYFPRDNILDSMQPDDQNSQAGVPSINSSEHDGPSSQTADADASDDDEDKDETEEECTTVQRRSKRATKGIPPQRYAWQLSKAPSPLICNVTIPPDNFAQIKDLPDSEQDKWYDAMQAEMDSLKKLKVFTPSKPATNKKIIGTRWIYRIKKKPNGESLYKARLVAQGFAQRYPEDYTNTYSPTVRTESVKIALTTATILGLEVFQFDVDTAYLHADLDEDIYVRSPPGFRQQEGDIWYLNKSLYGLKQSGLMWYLCLTDKLNSMGFIKSKTDECVFTKRSNNVYEIILVYVDDIVYIGPNEKMSKIFAKALQRYFTLKSLGHINTYLGVQIEKTQKGFSLSQEDKIEHVLHHCNMKDANTTKTPMQTDFHNLTHEPSPEFEDQTLYRSVIGSLLYISSWTRPDISLSVNLLSRHVGKATQFHWSCIKKLLRYLKHTKHMKLLLEPTHTDHAELNCYADSDWASDKKSRKSTSGYMMFLNGCPVYWQVRKQNFISCSSTEAEYACVSDACNSLTWFDALITDIWTSPIRPITVMEDNESVVYISESHFTGSRSRHIDIRYRNTKQLVKQGFIKMKYVSTHDQIADMLNKPLPAAQHEYLRKKMCLI